MFRVFLLLMLWVAPLRAQELPIRPGLWEFAMAGMPHKQSICLKPEMVKDIKSLGQRQGEGSDCKSSDEKASGNTRSFKVSCTKPHKFDGTVTMVVNGPDRFSMQQDYTMHRDGRTQKGSLKINYKRLGDC